MCLVSCIGMLSTKPGCFVLGQGRAWSILYTVVLGVLLCGREAVFGEFGRKDRCEDKDGMVVELSFTVHFTVIC